MFAQNHKANIRDRELNPNSLILETEKSVTSDLILLLPERYFLKSVDF